MRVSAVRESIERIKVSRNSMKHHKTQNVIIEKAAVDVEMADIVKALNSNGCIRTLFCCQGTLKKDSNYLFEEGTCYVLMDISPPKVI